MQKKRRAVAADDRIKTPAQKTIDSSTLGDAGKLTPAKAPGVLLTEEPTRKKPSEEEPVEKQAPKTPPKEASELAALGLRLRGEFSRGGTPGSIALARELINRRELSDDMIERMAGFFLGATEPKDDPGWGNEADPSEAWIAWLLCGGDPGKNWVMPLAKIEKDEGVVPEILALPELAAVHTKAHELMRRKNINFGSIKASVEDLVNLHARVVSRFVALGHGHPPPPSDGLDEYSAEFEIHKAIEGDTNPDGLAKAITLWDNP
jgi:hypothetical protein